MENLNMLMLDHGDDTRLVITVHEGEYYAELIDSPAKRKVLYSAQSDDLATIIRMLDDQVYTDMVTP